MTPEASGLPHALSQLSSAAALLEQDGHKAHAAAVRSHIVHVHVVLGLLVQGWEPPAEWCERCLMTHDGPVCVCGEQLYSKGPAAWQHVHTVGLTDHVPTPAMPDSEES